MPITLIDEYIGEMEEGKGNPDERQYGNVGDEWHMSGNFIGGPKLFISGRVFHQFPRL